MTRNQIGCRFHERHVVNLIGPGLDRDDIGHIELSLVTYLSLDYLPV